MTESEARSKIKHRIGVVKEIAGFRFDSKSVEDLEIAIQALKEIRQHREMQDKLKQWIENYKNPEFKDVMITRDNLIDILNEFRLECEKPMKEVTVVMNVQVTRILKNVPVETDSKDLAEYTTNYAVGTLQDAGYDNVLVTDMKYFEGGEADERNIV